MLDSAVRLGDLARLPETYLGRSFSQLPNHAAMGSRAHVKQNAASSISSELYDRCVVDQDMPAVEAAPHGLDLRRAIAHERRE